MNHKNMYTVKNKFLRAIMGNYTKSQLDLNVDYDIEGLTHGKGAGSTILTYIVKKAFNIHRLPFYEDRHFTNSSGDAIIHGYGERTLEKVLKCDMFLNNIDDMTEELKDIYSFTQKKLDEIYPNQDYVELIRNVEGGYAATLLQLKNNAQETSSVYIKIETDTVDCFTNNPGKYYKHACYRKKIAKEDILYFDKVLDNNLEILIEYNEYIVMNRDIKGLREIPINGIEKTNPDFDEFSYMTRPIIGRNEYCHIRSSANRFVCFDEAQIKPSFEKKTGILCKIVEKFCRD